MTQIRARILVRTDIDWRSMTARQFAEQDDAYRPLGFVHFVARRNVLSLWNEAFAVDFFDFRASLQALSQRNLRGVAHTRLTMGWADFTSWYRSEEDEMIFPIDDDDFFHPALASLAPRASDPVDLVLWPHLQYAYDATGRPLMKRLPLAALLTNNWGVRKSFLKRHFAEEEARRLLADHKAASLAVAGALGVAVPRPPEQWFSMQLRGHTVNMLSSSFGFSLKHVGSLMSLHQALGAARPIEVLLRPQLGTRANIPDDLGWAELWVRKAEAIFERLSRS